MTQGKLTLQGSNVQKHVIFPNHKSHSHMHKLLYEKKQRKRRTDTEFDYSNDFYQCYGFIHIIGNELITPS